MGTNTMYVHRMGYAATTYTHTHRGKHCTCLMMVHTIHIQTHVHCMQGVNLFSAHTLEFSSIELLVCMFKRTLVLFSISVWTEFLYS